MYEETLSITVSGEASEWFADHVRQMDGWYVKLTTREGEKVEASIVTPMEDIGWYDAVTFRPVTEDGLPVEGSEPRTVRVKDIYVY